MANNGGKNDRRGSNDSERKVRIRLKTDGHVDPREIKAPKNKSAFKGAEPIVTEDQEEEHEKMSSQQSSSSEQGAEEVQRQNPIELNGRENEKELNVDKAAAQPLSSDPHAINAPKNKSALKEAEPTGTEDQQEEQEKRSSHRSSSSEQRAEEAQRQETKELKGKENEKELNMDKAAAKPLSLEPGSAKKDEDQAVPGIVLPESGTSDEGESSVDTGKIRPLMKHSDEDFKNGTSPVREMDETINNAESSVQRDKLMQKSSDRKPGEGENVIPDKKESIQAMSVDSKPLSKSSNNELTQEINASKEIKKSSSSSITGRIRQSIEKLIISSRQSLRASTESKDLDEKGNSSLSKNNSRIVGAAKEPNNTVDGNGKMDDAGEGGRVNLKGTSGINTMVNVNVHNQGSIKSFQNEGLTAAPSTKVSIKMRRNTNEEHTGIDEKTNSKGNEATYEGDKRSSEITVTTNSIMLNSNAMFVSSIKTQSDNEMADADDFNPKSADEPIMGSQKLVRSSHDKIKEQAEGIINDLTKNETEDEGPLINVGGNEEERKDGKDDGEPVQLKRITPSEDLKIKELKDRVRPGPVFVVRGEPGSFTVRWAEKRKVLAYKVGSKNTSRFSTVLTETVEELERVSVKNPSILSGFSTLRDGSPIGSILSTYLAGVNVRRSIRNNTIRDVGTHIDDQHELSPEQISTEPRADSPADRQVWMTDHISPDKEVFGGVEPVHKAPINESNNYNYPFLTDYDVNHERKGNK